MKEGRGNLSYANGNVYDGEFRADKKEGRGKMSYANSDVYDGEFKADKKEGRGTYTNADRRECTRRGARCHSAHELGRHAATARGTSDALHGSRGGRSDAVRNWVYYGGQSNSRKPALQPRFHGPSKGASQLAYGWSLARKEG